MHNTENSSHFRSWMFHDCGKSRVKWSAKRKHFLPRYATCTKGSTFTKRVESPSRLCYEVQKAKRSGTDGKDSNELERLALEAYPDDQNIRANRNLIECFISGIRDDELAIKLLQENFDNLANAINRAVQYQQALQTRHFIKNGNRFQTNNGKDLQYITKIGLH